MKSSDYITLTCRIYLAIIRRIIVVFTMKMFSERLFKKSREFNNLDYLESIVKMNEELIYATKT